MRKAGSELDALVGIHVMNWKYQWDGMESYAWYDSAGKLTYWGDGGVANIKYKPFHPSTDIAAAWEVVRNMRSRIFSVRNRFEDELQLAVSTRVAMSGQLVHHKAIVTFIEPVDICFAALKAVGVDVE